MFFSTDCSKAVVPMLVLLLCGLFYEVICFKFCLVLFCSCIFIPFSIVITSLGEERELILVLFVCLFDLHLFGYVCFLFVSGRAAACDCGTPWTFLLSFLGSHKASLNPQVVYYCSFCGC